MSPEPIKRAAEVQNFLNFLAGQDVPDAIRHGSCVRCGDHAVMRSELEEREYTISGLCGPCQDIAFAPIERWESEDWEIETTVKDAAIGVLDSGVRSVVGY